VPDTALPPEIAEAVTRAGARLGLFAGRIRWYSEVTSTNDLAIRLADAGAAAGTTIVADAQTAGRGRLGRAWASPAGAGLYTSIVLRPAPHVTRLLTLAAGVAIADGIQCATGLVTQVKWPNDIYVGGRKLAGILAEAGSAASGIPHVVVGFGINVLPAAYPADVAARATSIETELGRPVDRGQVLAESLAALAAWYVELEAGRGAPVIEQWRHRAVATFGRPVEWSADGAVQTGVAENIDENGALLVKTNAGVMRVISGEVRWL
jgi:BirA family biotin operon repressor/biotin-[acetyl-CoA-carboxylase] ligase